MIGLLLLWNSQTFETSLPASLSLAVLFLFCYTLHFGTLRAWEAEATYGYQQVPENARSAQLARYLEYWYGCL